MTEKVKDALVSAMQKIAAFCMDHDLKMSTVTEYFERAWFDERLKREGNNRCAIAEIEGVHRNTVARRMKALGMPCGMRGGKGVRNRHAELT